MKNIVTFSQFSIQEGNEAGFMQRDPMVGMQQMVPGMVEAMKELFGSKFQMVSDKINDMVDDLFEKLDDSKLEQMLKSIEKFFGVPANKITYDLIVSKLKTLEPEEALHESEMTEFQKLKRKELAQQNRQKLMKKFYLVFPSLINKDGRSVDLSKEPNLANKITSLLQIILRTNLYPFFGYPLAKFIEFLSGRDFSLTEEIAGGLVVSLIACMLAALLKRFTDKYI
jgi:hypothetical protein